MEDKITPEMGMKEAVKIIRRDLVCLPDEIKVCRDNMRKYSNNISTTEYEMKKIEHSVIAVISKETIDVMVPPKRKDEDSTMEKKNKYRNDPEREAEKVRRLDIHEEYRKHRKSMNETKEEFEKEKDVLDHLNKKFSASRYLIKTYELEGVFE